MNLGRIHYNRHFQKLEQLKEDLLGQDHRPQIFLNIYSYDKNHKLYETKSLPAKSLVKGFLWRLFSQLQQTSVAEFILSVDNVPRQVGTTTFNMNFGAGDTSGIRVGSSNQAVAITDNKLIAMIAHGIGSGQLNHSVHTHTQPFVIGNSVISRTKRNFDNQSGGNVTVREVGWIGDSITSGFLYERRVLPSDEVIPNTESRDFEYEFRISLT